MAHPDTPLKQLARQHYEKGRLRRAAIPALLALALTAIMLAHGASAALCLTIGALLTLLVTVMVWRGEGWDRAAIPGLLAGGSAGALALVIQNLDACCVGQESAACIAACVFGGAAAGALLTVRAIQSQTRRQRILLGSGAVAALTASMGCAAGGLFGLLGMLVALVALSAPVYWWRTARET